MSFLEGFLVDASEEVVVVVAPAVATAAPELAKVASSIKRAGQALSRVSNEHERLHVGSYSM